jgi:hypothetical protein
MGVSGDALPIPCVPRRFVGRHFFLPSPSPRWTAAANLAMIPAVTGKGNESGSKNLKLQIGELGCCKRWVGVESCARLTSYSTPSRFYIVVVVIFFLIFNYLSFFKILIQTSKIIKLNISQTINDDNN